MTSALLFCLAPVLLSTAPHTVGPGQDTSTPPPGPPGPVHSRSMGPADLGGAFHDPRRPPVVSLGMGGTNTFVYQLNLPHRRWKEEFVVVRPDPTLGFPTPYPVLTLFHGYGETPLAVTNTTPLAQAAASRGWLVVIPLGAHIYNYGIDYAQDNIEDVFEAVQLLAPVDLDRIYAVGFSMGGGAAASYAARHLDPSHVRFAAVVNHTGSTSLRDTFNFNAGGIAALFQSPLMFGGTPSNAPFRYQRSSAIDLKPGNIVDPETDMVRNLVHVPVFHFSASNDPLQYLVTQSYQMHLRLQQWGGTSDWDTVASSSHAWTTLANTILDELEPLTLQAPAEGAPVHVLADRDGRWHHVQVRQARDKRLSPFTYQWSSGSNSLAFSDVENVSTLSVELTDPALRLNPLSSLQVSVQTRTLEPLDIELGGFAAPPSGVSRDGSATTDWTWSSAAQTVTLHESFGVFGTTWVVAP